MNLFSMNSPFARGINKLVQMLYVGLLWFLCSLPVFTIGAATTALYEVLLKMEKEREGYIGASFFRAFRKNFKSATLVFLPILLAFIIFGVNLFYYGVLGGGNFPVQSVVFTVLFLAVVVIAGYVFPVMARFENTTKGTFCFSVILAVRNPGWTVVLLVIWAVTLLICWFFLYFPILFMMGISGYMQAVIFNHMFDRLIEQGKITEVSEGEEEKDGR